MEIIRGMPSSTINLTTRYLGMQILSLASDTHSSHTVTQRERLTHSKRHTDGHTETHTDGHTDTHTHSHS